MALYGLIISFAIFVSFWHIDIDFTSDCSINCIYYITKLDLSKKTTKRKRISKTKEKHSRPKIRKTKQTKNKKASMYNLLSEEGWDQLKLILD